MALTILEFGDVNEATGDPIYPPVNRRTNLNNGLHHAIGLDQNYNNGQPYPVRGVLVYTTANVHLRVTRENNAAANADQNDPFIAADGTAFFLVQRKDRAAGRGNELYLNAVADT